MLQYLSQQDNVRHAKTTGRQHQAKAVPLEDHRLPGTGGTVARDNATFVDNRKPLQKASDQPLQRVHHRPPQVATIITEGNQLIQAAQEDGAVKSTYVTEQTRNAYTTALARTEAMVQKWTPFHGSFSDNQPNGKTALQPRASSFFNDESVLVNLYRAQIQAVTNLNLTQVKTNWVTGHVIAQNRWNRIPSFDANLIDKNANETQNVFKGRIKQYIRLNYTIKNAAWFYQTLGFNGHFRSWNVGSGYHTTLYRTALNSVDVSYQNAFDSRVTILVGTNRGFQALHCTKEDYGLNSPTNPKYYVSGSWVHQPASNQVCTTMTQKANTKQGNVENGLTHGRNQVLAPLQNGWQDA